MATTGALGNYYVDSFQSKAAVFGASWNPVHAAGANAVPAAVYHHHHHPYVHPQAPVAAAAPDGS